jgi:hypothetical protein
MEKLPTRLVSRTIILALLGSVFLFGCQSTATENSEPNCQTESSDNCVEEGDMGDDRGFNPCLVNKKLPICKK